MGEARLSLYDLTVYSQAEGLGPLRQAIIYYCNCKRNESKSRNFPRWSQNGFYSFASKITEGGYCSHEIKRHLLLERKPMIKLVAAQLFSCIQLFVTPWTEALQASLSFTIFYSLLKLMSTELSDAIHHLILCCPLLLMPSIFPCIGVFSNEPGLCTGLKFLFSLLSKGLTRVFSNIIVQKHQFLSAQTTLWCNSHIHTCLMEKPKL